MASAPLKHPTVWILAAIAAALLILFANRLKNIPSDQHDAPPSGPTANTTLPGIHASHNDSSKDHSRSARTPREIHPSPAGRKPRSATHPAPTATPELGDAYLGTSLQEMEPGYNLDEVCTLAGQEFNVPPDLLKAVAFLESEGNHGSGRANARGGRGLMGLRDTPEHDTLHEAARLLNLPAADLVRDPLQNARGAAALLRQYHTEATRTTSETNPGNQAASADNQQVSPGNQAWITALSYYSTLPPEQSVTYTQDIANILQEGAIFPSPDGTTTTIHARQTWGE